MRVISRLNTTTGLLFHRDDTHLRSHITEVLQEVEENRGYTIQKKNTQTFYKAVMCIRIHVTNLDV